MEQSIPSQKASSDSPLLTLPAEIRNRIYRLVLNRVADKDVTYLPKPQPKIYKPPQLRSARTERLKTDRFTHRSHDEARSLTDNAVVLLDHGLTHRTGYLYQQPALLQVNRQVKQEASSIYYKGNRFHIVIHCFDAERYVRWRESSDARRHASLTFQVTTNGGWRSSHSKHLLDWLHAYFHRQCEGYFSCEQQEEELYDQTPYDMEGECNHFIRAARLFKMVRRARDVTKRLWNEVHDDLEDIMEGYEDWP